MRGIPFVDAVAKYAARGWTVVEDLHPNIQDNPYADLRLGARWVDDGHSWVLPLPPLPAPASASSVKEQPDAFSLNSFTLTRNADDGLPEIGYALITAPELATTYTASYAFARKVPMCLAALREQLKRSGSEDGNAVRPE